MVVLLPVVLVLLAVGLLNGGTHLVLLLPVALTLGAGAIVISIALRDGRPPNGRPVRRLPTGHLQRQLYQAQRPHRRATRPPRQDEPPE